MFCQITENAEFLHLLTEDKVNSEEVIKLNPESKTAHALLKQVVEVIMYYIDLQLNEPRMFR